MSPANLPVLGILLGDPAGVGPEIIAKLCVNGFLKENCRPVLIGDRRVLERAFGVIGASADIRVIDQIDDADWENGIPMLDRKNADPAEIPFATGTLTGGHANIDGMTLAVELYQQGKIQGFCFGPFNKAWLKEDPAMLKADGTHFESEHHFLANLLHHTAPFGEINALGNLMTTRTTSHIPIKEVSSHLTPESIGRAIDLMYATLKNAGYDEPRIAVAGLNPHNGENGTCGREEIDVIAPTVKAAQEKYHTDKITGPYPADTLFVKAFRGDFDGAVTMFHDQGQIALKVMGFDEGITVVGGLEIPIVTCGHGTAYDIAGKNIVSTHSFENAVKMCAKMANAKAGK